jgi:hypothetical protein
MPEKKFNSILVKISSSRCVSKENNDTNLFFYKIKRGAACFHDLFFHIFVSPVPTRALKTSRIRAKWK